MKLMDPTIFIISADPAVAQECINELALCGRRYRLPVACSMAQARLEFFQTPPVAVFLDESAVDPQRDGGSLESAVGWLTEIAPVVVAAAPHRQMELAFLIASGAVDFVARTDHFLQIAAGLLGRRVHLAERAAGTIQFPNSDFASDFGEILRHEVNNPLTGILGNTELLLARPDRLPPGAVERLQTIADLAVRLRETVRRLSNSCDEHHEAVRPA
jgi:signal transduction histidine kinase